MEFLLVVLVVLISAKFFGEIAERLGLPSILGYLVAGMALGLVGFLTPSEHNIAVFGQMGAILLLFVAGMRELDAPTILKNKRATYGSAVLGFLLSFLFVLVAISSHWLYASDSLHVAPNLIVVLSAALAVCSVVPSMKVFVKERKLNTVVGRVVLGSAVLIALFGLGVFTVLSVFLTTGATDLVSAFTEVFFVSAMLLVIFVVSSDIVPYLIDFSNSFEVEEAQFALVFIVMLVLALTTWAFGLHGVIGAFIAGMVVSKVGGGRAGFSEKMASLSYGVFVPIFFAWVGSMFVGFVPDLLFFVLMGSALGGSFLGGFIGSLLGRISAREALVVGLGLIPRGGISLVMLAAIKTGAPWLFGGVVGDYLYSVSVLVVVVSMVVTPFLLGSALKLVEEKRIYRL